MPSTTIDTAAVRANHEGREPDLPLDLLRCPVSGKPLSLHARALCTNDGRAYPVSPAGIVMFAETDMTEDARRQQDHYDAIAAAYEENLGYPHTRAYLEYLDEALFTAIGPAPLGVVAELCCGTGVAANLFAGRYARLVGVDISSAMLERAARENADMPTSFVQGDATRLPLASESFDTVAMLGGIHHVNDRAALFAEVSRVLKPGGRFIFREPVSDFMLWRGLRAIIYRLSPMLDYATERPLLWKETVPPLERSGLKVGHWSTHGFLGFCLFMNSDVLVFNRLFRFIPGISAITRATTKLDALTLRLPGMSKAGLQVIGVAEKSPGANS